MSALHDYDRFDTADPAPVDYVSPESLATPTLLERLDAKLKELTELGYSVQWLEIAEPQLVTLFTEGGDDVIRLDADPDIDKGWYGDIEVRATERTCIWIFIHGEVENEVSAHVIA